MGEDAHVEIVDWVLVEMPAAGGTHRLIGMNIIRILDAYLQKHDIDAVMPDQMTYLMNSLSTDLKVAFGPGVSFIAQDSVLDDWGGKLMRVFH